MTRIRLAKVLAITVWWVALAAAIAVHDHLLYLAFEADLATYDFGRSVLLLMAFALVGGLIAASIVVFVIKERLRRRPFAVVVLAHTLTYVGVTVILTLCGNLVYYAIDLGRPLFDPETIAGGLNWFLGPWTVKNLFFWTLVAGLTSFLVEVFDVLGPGMAKDFVLGRYHVPQTEHRCFMFLDLRSSTTIAERLGHTDYFRMLNDFYADITESIADTSGDIYQYVGDEVIVSWTGDKGLQDARCLRCYFQIQEAIQRLGRKYQDRYGLVPEFKASFHFGEVTAGEIGLLKRDIVFTGDVLNTAARIQERCNVHGTDTLLSGDLMTLLPADAGFRFTPVEEIELRGKAAPTTLYRADLDES